MILYKYYGYESGLAALKSQCLGFREPRYFNDPFELSALSHVSEGDADILEKVNKIRDSVVILSLTRTPLNPLMWAHYGDEHKGFVVGYKVDTGFFQDPEFSLVPIDEGDVFYTNTKTPLNVCKDKLHKTWLDTLGAFDRPQEKLEFNKLSRKLFLTKHSTWVYEEEVRVVKPKASFFMTCADFQSHPFRSFNSLDNVPGLRIYHQQHTISEVYLGVRNPLLSEGNGSDELYELANRENWDLSKIVLDDKSWSLKSSVLDSAEMLSKI